MPNIDEEPYSGIFTSLKHPFRRKIIRLLAEKPRSFSEILESLRVSNSYLTYHLENLGQLVSKMDDGRYALSVFGEAAFETMSMVEDIPRAKPAQPKDHLEVGLSKWSKRMQFLTSIYTLILVGAIILAGIYFANFTISSFNGPSWVEEANVPVQVQPNGTYTYRIAVAFKNGGNTWRVGVPEDGTNYFDFPPPYTMLTSWTTLRLWAIIEANESFSAWTTTYYPDGRNTTYIHEGIVGTELIPFQNAQAGTYRMDIKNIASQEMHAQIKLHIEREFFEKPYFNYGIAALIIASISVPLFAFKIFRWATEPLDYPSS